MQFKNISRQTKKELKLAEKERKRCQKLYPDWKNDAYNCGPLKFIFGTNYNTKALKSEFNFYTLNDLTISYNRDTNKYLLDIETNAEFKSNQDRIDYLDCLLLEFKKYLDISDQFDLNYNPFLLYRYNDDLFIANSLTELYYKFKIFVKGYEQL